MEEVVGHSFRVFNFKDPVRTRSLLSFSVWVASLRPLYICAFTIFCDVVVGRYSPDRYIFCLYKLCCQVPFVILIPRYGLFCKSCNDITKEVKRATNFLLNFFKIIIIAE